MDTVNVALMLFFYRMSDDIKKKLSGVPSSNEQLLVLSMLKSTVTLVLEMAIQFLDKLDILMRCALLSIGFFSVLFDAVKYRL
jgi:hypothetical protein